MFKNFLVTIVFASLSLSANAASFMKIEGIKGESQYAQYRDQIDVLAWSWGSSKEGRTNCAKDIIITKYIDIATPKLLVSHATSQVHPTVELAVTTQNSTFLTEYIKIKLKNAQVTSLSTGGSNGESRLTESISLSFTGMEMTYSKIDSSGRPGTPVTETIDVSRCK